MLVLQLVRQRCAEARGDDETAAAAAVVGAAAARPGRRGGIAADVRIRAAEAL